MHRRAHTPTLQHAHTAPTPAAPVQQRSASAQARSDPKGVSDPVQTKRATRLGHHFGRVRVSPPAASKPIQARAAEERPSGQHLAPAGRGKPLPEAVQTKMERAFGQDFSGVRIHEGRTAESIGAVAFTRGQDIHFAPGKYSPASRHGQELIGHELAHVVQQRAGRVALPQGKGAPINADPSLEAEADAQGTSAARISATASPLQRATDSPLEANGPIQLTRFDAGHGRGWHVHKGHVKFGRDNSTRLNFSGRSRRALLKHVRSDVGKRALDPLGYNAVIHHIRKMKSW